MCSENINILIPLSLNELSERERTYRGIYHDIGTVLDGYSIEQLFEFVKSNLNMDVSLRYYLEQQIIAYVSSCERENT